MHEQSLFYVSTKTEPSCEHLDIALVSEVQKSRQQIGDYENIFLC